MNTFTTLISAEDAQALFVAPAAAAAPAVAAAPAASAASVRPVVIDASFDLADVGAGAAAWRAARIPGSIYLHLERDLSGTKTGRNGRHPLPQRHEARATFGRAGVRPETQVVVLDRQGGPYAARVWWLLRWLGHEAVAVLDGGFAAWVEAGGAVIRDTAPASADDAGAPYPERPALVATTDADRLARRLGRVHLIDARAPARFRGDVEPLDRAAGHIPGAANRFYQDNLDASGRFKPAAVLRADFEPLLGGEPADTAVHQCGSGVTACHNLLAMEHAGLGGSVLYPGSWSEWSSDPARPVARG